MKKRVKKSEKKKKNENKVENKIEKKSEKKIEKNDKKIEKNGKTSSEIGGGKKSENKKTEDANMKQTHTSAGNKKPLPHFSSSSSSSVSSGQC